MKIDRSFISDVHTNRESAHLVKAILALAHSLKLRVIAEGVETREQSGFLYAAGCELVQGYYYSPPLPASSFELLMREQGGRIPRLMGSAPPEI